MQTFPKTWLALALAVLVVCTCIGVWFFFTPLKNAPALSPSIALPALSHMAAAPEDIDPAYIEIMDGCAWDRASNCVNVRTGPGTNFPAIMGLRTGMVLPIATTTVTDSTGRVWYKVVFTEWLRFPERVSTEWYVASDYVRRFHASSVQEYVPGETASTTKHILIDRSEQRLYAYDGATLYMQSTISTGVEFHPTPRGVYMIYRKTPSRYMQGPLPEITEDFYDLPGVPWDMYFTDTGGAIHGAYWHNSFGTPWSHGCVNMPPEEARTLYQWADVGTEVIVQE